MPRRVAIAGRPVGKTPNCKETIYESISARNGAPIYYHMHEGKRVYDTTRVRRGELNLSGERRHRRSKVAGPARRPRRGVGMGVIQRLMAVPGFEQPSPF